GLELFVCGGDPIDRQGLRPECGVTEGVEELSPGSTFQAHARSPPTRLEGSSRPTLPRGFSDSSPGRPGRRSSACRWSHTLWGGRHLCSHRRSGPCPRLYLRGRGCALQFTPPHTRVSRNN